MALFDIVPGSNSTMSAKYSDFNRPLFLMLNILAGLYVDRVIISSIDKNFLYLLMK